MNITCGFLLFIKRTACFQIKKLIISAAMSKLPRFLDLKNVQIMQQIIQVIVCGCTVSFSYFESASFKKHKKQ